MYRGTPAAPALPIELFDRLYPDAPDVERDAIAFGALSRRPPAGSEYHGPDATHGAVGSGARGLAEHAPLAGA